MKITFLKTSKAKKFNYQPRFYDAQKEADAKRKKEIEDNIKNPERLNMRREMKQKWGRHDRTRQKSKTYSLAILIALLFALIYIMFF